MRRNVMLWVGLLAWAWCGVGFAQSPNVVMILSDDQMWTDYGFMGHEVIETPHLDKLAAESATFRHGYVPTSLCRPSLATMISGLYPHQHQITGNDQLPTGQGKPPREALIKFIDDVPTLPKLLGDKGYLSHQSGKWWEGHHRRGGFTHGMTHGDVKRGGRHGDVGLKIGREGMQPIYNFISEAQAADKPFFLWYAPFLPHSPHNPPQRLLDKYKDKTPSIHQARYWAMCEWFDETCGELLTHLDKQGLSDNTLVVYVCDNGWIQNQNDPHYAPRSKRSPFDGGVRTPIMVRWPGKIKPAQIDTPVSSIDLAPTILQACGVKPTTDLPGIDLMDSAAIAARDVLYGEILEHDVPEPGNPAAGLMYRWCRRGPWKIIVPHGAYASEPIRLFNLSDDPHENKNLAEEKPQEVAELKALLDAWWKP